SWAWGSMRAKLSAGSVPKGGVKKLDSQDLSYQDERVSAAWSFRDPGGAVVALQGHIFRVVNTRGMADLGAFLDSPAVTRWVGSGAVVATRVLAEDDKNCLLQDPGVASTYAVLQGKSILQHDCIPFASFPYEWAPEMLHAAARLTLDLMMDLLEENLGLKDAT